MEPVIAQVDPVQTSFIDPPAEQRSWKWVKMAVQKANVAALDPRFRSERPPKPQIATQLLEQPLLLDSYVFDAAYEVEPGGSAEGVAVGVKLPWAFQPSPTPAPTPPAGEGQVTGKRYTDADIPGFSDLTLEAFAHLHAALLWRQLELLLWSKDANGHARQEILDWIFDPLVHQHSKTGELKVVDGIDWPFSFELCCHLEEVDPLAIKRAIVDRLHTIKQGAGHRIRASLH